MADRYRALLIGNSTYPADEHNLQTLRGPVKDIAALNRALIDPSTGLFADIEVALLPEATSTRAIRALGRFFGTATRDDVLLVYFSGHGKLDQSGRLHLCMQDTESAELLSTAVSSARIKEFADASRARNVVIVLDCCYAGAFRGADLGEAVAGPGRYVLTSCRGTQLANDATVENGTSLFTQHLIDGLLGAAADQGGYVTFSTLYAYVDRQLREAGKQIPQRRVDGDGDVPLARRRPPAPHDVTAAAQAGQTAAATSPGRPERPASDPAPDPPAASNSTIMQDPAPRQDRPQPGRTRRRVLLATAGAALVIAAGVIAALTLPTGGSGGQPSISAGLPASFNASAPWRLQIIDEAHGPDPGCVVGLTDVHSGSQVLQTDRLYPPDYAPARFQIYQTGSFKLTNSSPSCLVTSMAGSGMAKLPFPWNQHDDTDAFAAPARVAVQVKVYDEGPECSITLVDPASGEQIETRTAEQGKNNDTVVLNTHGHRRVYLSGLSCKVFVSAAR
jgi:hypothetical protein